MNRFLLILGVSGVGKTSIINELLRLDSRYVYISPYITRPLRNGETDKISVSPEDFQRMLATKKILAVNDIYGIRYATPREPINTAFETGQYPILDWPIKRLAVMEREFGKKLYRVYLEPPSISELRCRLGQDGRDESGERLISAINELEKVWCGDLTNKYDLRIVTNKDVSIIGREIHSSYIESLAD